jgi:hypothetical protein
MTDFVLGGSMVACLAIALFFFRFWRKSGDRLFAAFAGAFLVFGANRLILTLTSEDGDGRIYSYALRFLAFMLVVWGVVDKNRAQTSPRAPAQFV